MGGTAGAILTCPLEVVKTRLQSSNSGFDTTLKAAEVVESSHSTGTTTCRTLPHKKFWTRPESGLYRPRFALSAWGGGHAAQIQACRPVNSQLIGHTPDRPAPGYGMILSAENKYRMRDLDPEDPGVCPGLGPDFEPVPF